jgi:hypothetical protein
MSQLHCIVSNRLHFQCGKIFGRVSLTNATVMRIFEIAKKRLRIVLSSLNNLVRLRPINRRPRAAIYACHQELLTNPHVAYCQIVRSTQYAQLLGAEVNYVFQDASRPSSGSIFVANQPALLEMVEAAARGDFSVLIVDDICRLSRDLPSFEILLEIFSECGVELHSANGKTIGLSRRSLSDYVSWTAAGFLVAARELQR